MSFGARAGGFSFAYWLRLKIMESKGYTQENNVYLGTIALQKVPNTSSEIRGTKTAGGLASLNPHWQLYYKHAMSTAQTMIFILTKEWLESEFCKQELDWCLTEGEKRKFKMLGIAMVDSFTSAQSPSARFNGVKMIYIPARQFVVEDEQLRESLNGHLRNQWLVNKPKLDKILAELE